MHQQIVAFVIPPADILGNTRGHRNRRYTCGADQGVNLAAGCFVHDDAAAETSDGRDRESDQTENDDLDGIQVQEVLCDHGGADGGGKEDRDDIHQCVLCCIGQTIGHAALTEQVAEHQAADQRSRGGEQQDDEGGNDDRKNDLLGLGNLAALDHLDLAHLIVGHQLHDRGLDQRNQRHVGIRGDGDGSQQLRRELGGQVDGCGAVRTADDADGCCLGAGKAEQHRAEERDEDAELGRGTEQQTLGIREQRPEVGHGTYAHEDQRGIDAGLNADIKEVQQAAVRHDMAVAVIIRTGGIKKGFPKFGVVEGVSTHADKVAQVRKQTAERNAAEQQRLKLLYDTEIQEHEGDDDHDDILPTAFCCKESREAGFKGQLLQDTHYFHTGLLMRSRRVRCPFLRRHPWRQQPVRLFRPWGIQPRFPSSWPRESEGRRLP